MDELLIRLNDPLTPELSRMAIGATLFYLGGFFGDRLRKPKPEFSHSIQVGAVCASIAVLFERVVNYIEPVSNFKNELLSFVGNLLN